LSLSLGLKSAAGLVLAAESRRTFFVAIDPRQRTDVTRYAVVDDDVKLFALPDPPRWVALAFAGDADGSMCWYVSELEDAMPPERLRVVEYAERVGNVLKRYAEKMDVTTIVAGFDPGETGVASTRWCRTRLPSSSTQGQSAG
jgi:20S proteasome alpha/beta subunit